MIIQNTNSPNQVASMGTRVSDNAPAPVAEAPIQVTAPQPSPQQLKTAVDGINQAMRQSRQNLEFTVDTGTKMSVVKVVDTETGQLVLQIPSKVTLAIAESIGQSQHGMLLSQKV